MVLGPSQLQWWLQACLLFVEVSLTFHAGLMVSDNLWFHFCCLFSLAVASLDSPNFLLKHEHFAQKKM